MDNLINQILFYAPLLAISVSIVILFVSIIGINLTKKKLNERKISYKKMESNFNDLANRVKKELDKD